MPGNREVPEFIAGILRGYHAVPGLHEDAASGREGMQI
jgi:hypothetical protein